METKIKMIVYKLESKFGTYAKLLHCSFRFYEKMEMSYFAWFCSYMNIFNNHMLYQSDCNSLKKNFEKTMFTFEVRLNAIVTWNASERIG